MQVEIKNISKRYKGKQVLKDISLSAQGGSCIGILGVNGSGKSTLLSILAGVVRPDGGSFLCDGNDLLLEKALRSRCVGFVPQGTPLLEELCVKDNLLLWYDSRQLRQELEDGVLKLLGIEDFLKMPVSKLSGGMKKRLSIGCAVANRPPILLLDEPTAALDLPCKAEISRYLQQYKRAGGLLLLTTHDVTELSLCDRCYILKDGILVPFSYDGDVRKLLDSL
jgi:ABC-2 type transport system ATP-binding protein